MRKAIYSLISTKTSKCPKLKFKSLKKTLRNTSFRKRRRPKPAKRFLAWAWELPKTITRTRTRARK